MVRDSTSGTSEHPIPKGIIASRITVTCKIKDAKMYEMKDREVLKTDISLSIYSSSGRTRACAVFMRMKLINIQSFFGP